MNNDLNNTNSNSEKNNLINDELNNNNEPINPTKIISIILIIIIFIGLALYMIHVDGLDNIITLLKSVDYKWVGGRCYNINFMVYM